MSKRWSVIWASPTGPFAIAINDLIAELGFETEEEDDATRQRHEILAKVDRGELAAGEAAELLSQLKQ